MNTTNEVEELRADIIKMIEEIAETLSDEELEQMYNEIKSFVETSGLKQ
ncbi:hypothetical protein KQI18_13555 [Clostridioides mangenotii]|nr:hypothetical protein [Clostridioides mangenotii]MBU5308788.1 hypothetical protein [Clostridioides mangenotii]